MFFLVIYVVVGMWCDVVKFRKFMKERGVKKEFGCSWIEIVGEVYFFVVRD